MKVYKAEPQTFQRTSEARRSNARQVLCDKTHLSHEQIEGWLIMIQTKVRTTTKSFKILERE
jgi:hypothetical protein